MILGIGVDIADNSRFIDIKEGLKEKLFSKYEIEKAKIAPSESEFLSSRFAAKEAFSKAMGTGFKAICPKYIEIREDDKGKPFICLLRKIDSDFKIHLSISHERKMSVAMVVLEDVAH